ncbi:MAG: glycosyltransferase family 4 protein [Planctomycetes bacterium]|nr:glycosyltransferase family 4 protein [Planctomycetota bacterium]
MRIAQIAPLIESVPPKLYGGTERVVSYLTEELVARGHDVTLFASGDSVTKARLVAPCRKALRLSKDCSDPLAHHILLLEAVAKRAKEFDLLHFHMDYLHFPVTRRLGLPTLTTVHGRLDLPDLVPLYREYTDMGLISISDAQRRPLRWARWMGTVYHGLPPDLFTYRDRPGDYLAFIGRFSPEKRCDRAVEIARRAGMKLKIAAKIDPADRVYFEEHVKPLLDSPWVEYVGEIDERSKDSFLGNAAALLFPVDWPEPFGLVMIEAFACGTPVIAWPHGSIPEVMVDGETGYLCASIDEAVEAVRKIARLDRRRCRRVFEDRFTVSRMAEDYLRLYEKALVGENAWTS